MVPALVLRNGEPQLKSSSTSISCQTGYVKDPSSSERGYGLGVTDVISPVASGYAELINCSSGNS